MGKRTKVEARSSSPTWETLRDWLRGKVRELFQELLELLIAVFMLLLTVLAWPLLEAVYNVK